MPSLTGAGSSAAKAGAAESQHTKGEASSNVGMVRKVVVVMSGVLT
jgi:hypothetical protein